MAEENKPTPPETLDASSAPKVASSNNQLTTETNTHDSVNFSKILDSLYDASKANSTKLDNLSKETDDQKKKLNVLQDQSKKHEAKFEDILSKINEISDKEKAKVVDAEKNIKDDNKKTDPNKSEPKKEKGLGKRLAAVVAAVIAPLLAKANEPKHKTNSKLNQKTQPVEIKSFSEYANQQLINNLKRVLVIKKQEAQVKTSSAIWKLAVLAFVGMLTYVMLNLEKVREYFTKWINNSKKELDDAKTDSETKISTFTASLKGAIGKLAVETIDNFCQPVKDWFTEKWDSITTTFSKLFGDTTKTIKDTKIETVGEVSKETTAALKDVKNFVNKDVPKSLENSYETIKKQTTQATGVDIFTKQQDESDDIDGGIKDNTSSTFTKSDTGDIGSGSTSSGTSESKSPEKQEPSTLNNKNINNINNTTKITNTGDNISDNSSSSLRLSNGNIINLNKSDDVYIANKPDGVIHSIFKEISTNYSNIGTFLKSHISDIINSISQQDTQFEQLISNLQLNDSKSVSESDVIAIVNNIVPKSPAPSITYHGVSDMRNHYRKMI